MGMFGSGVSSANASPVGSYGRVTGRVANGEVGEVMVSIRGGAETFYALPYSPGDEIAVGTRVMVAEYEPPRTVLVVAV